MRRWRGRTLAELIGRAARFGNVALERVGVVPRGTLPAAGVTRPELPFPNPTREELGRIYSARPQELEALLQRADAIRAGRFPLLGYDGLDFGSPVDWHRDPLRGKRVPLSHWSRIPFLAVEVVGDHKVIWELNRHQWLVTLAQAWRLTGDRGYLETLDRHWRDWLAANPPTRGINWASSLEVAFRSIAWTWTLFLLDQAPLPDLALRREIVRSLSLHGRHIERYRSTWFSPNTHLTGEALGLLYLGCAWPNLPRAHRWRLLGWRILCEQAVLQLRSDGTYFEQSSWYQAYTVDFYLHAARLSEGTGVGLPSGTAERLDCAATVLRELCREDGSLPLIGDDDGGRLLPLLPWPSRSFLDTLALAASVLGRPELCPPGMVPAAAAWLLDRDHWEKLASVRVAATPARSRAFPEGGWYFQSAGAGSRLLLDAGPHGALSGAHSHADALSCVLDLSSQPVLVDSGTFSYVGAERESFRLAEAHNTLTLNGRGSAEPSGLFRWSRFPGVCCDAWVSSERADYFEGHHDGFGAYWPGVKHVRAVLRLDAEGWLVIDLLEGPAPQGHGTLRFHLASGLQLRPASADAYAVERAASPLAQLLTDGAGSLTEAGAWMSECYGARTKTPVLIREIATQDLAGGVATLLAPSSSERAALLRVPATGGSGWRWELSEGWAIVLRRSPASELVKWEGIASRAATCCVLFSPGGEPRQTLVSGPGGASLAGVPLSPFTGWASPESA